MTRHASLLLLTWMALTCTSCAQTGLFRGKNSIAHLVATPNDPVIDAICLWETGSGTGLDGLPARGFAGQLMFFTKRIAQPVQIDGDITIYVFDDQGELDEQSKPIHQFHFTGEEIATFMTPSKVGISYQLFLPYTRSGGNRANCSLRVRYVPREGQGGGPVYSKFASILLSGPTVAKSNEPLGSKAANTAGGVQQASYETVTPIPSHLSQPGIPLGKLSVPPEATANQQDKLRLQRRWADLAQQAPAELTAPAAQSIQPVAPTHTEPAVSPQPTAESLFKLKPIPSAVRSEPGQHPVADQQPVNTSSKPVAEKHPLDL